MHVYFQNQDKLIHMLFINKMKVGTFLLQKKKKMLNEKRCDNHL